MTEWIVRLRKVSDLRCKVARNSLVLSTGIFILFFTLTSTVLSAQGVRHGLDPFRAITECACRFLLRAGYLPPQSAPSMAPVDDFMHPVLNQSALLWAVIAGSIVLLAGLVVRFCRGYHRRSLATARLQAELTRAQLQTMKAQLQPHFLFNTLNTISVLITENPAKANRMILLLSDLLRQTLETSQADEVTLKRELELLRAYVEIQRMRFRRRLSVSYDVNADILEAKIPHFTLQPIVENAIRHGIAKQRTGGRIDIRAHRVGGRLVLQVQDNGPGLSVESLRERNGNGIGLANTRKRLSCIYGSSSSMKIESGKPNGTVATIVIPFRESGKQS